MLCSKFAVSTIRLIGRRQSKYLSSVRRISKESSSNEGRDKFQNTKIEDNPSNCRKYQESLVRCPKGTHGYRNSKKITSETVPKCEKKSPADDYQKAYQAVTTATKKLLNNFEIESQLIIDQLEKDLQECKKGGEVQLQGFAKELCAKHEMLISLDPHVGTLKRRAVLSVNGQANEAFKALYREVAPSVQEVKLSLNKLRQDILICTQRANTLICSCRVCRRPQELERCIQENTQQAEAILEKTVFALDNKLEEIKQFRECILRNHKTVAEQVINTHRDKTSDLSKHLQSCINCINAIQKSNKNYSLQ